MFTKIHFIISLLYILSSFPLSAKEATDPHDLKRIADDTKYENALYFLNLKEYDKALEGFQEYLEIYLNGIHRKEAYKNTAKIYFDQFNYIRSIKTYCSLYEEFSSSEDGIEALFRIGVCYLKMGYNERAKGIFKSIIDDHPDSSYASLSKTNLDLLNIIYNN